ncbi:MAG: Holliday junction resolvase RuvX [Ectothiorhodospiraceae bacterium]|nr:Holliday junction resolvase RuvX [Ectothiorhodospiraceae bacterium]
MSAEAGRVLAIDYGKKRVGLAISDELRITANGLPTMDNKPGLVRSLAKIVAEREVRHIIIGMPYLASGDEGNLAADIRAFGDALEKHTGLQVEYVDESRSSIEAADTLREIGVGKNKRNKKRGKVDELSAVILLQEYIRD